MNPCTSVDDANCLPQDFYGLDEFCHPWDESTIATYARFGQSAQEWEKWALPLALSGFIATKNPCDIEVTHCMARCIP